MSAACGHCQEHQGRGHENCEAKKNDMSQLLNETMGYPQTDVKPSEASDQTLTSAEESRGESNGVEQGRLLYEAV
jgi:hypothetical protein